MDKFDNKYTGIFHDIKLLLCRNRNDWLDTRRIGMGTFVTCSTGTTGHTVTEFRPCDICVNKITIIDSDNGLSPSRRQAIIWTNAGILLIGPLGTNFSEILIEIHTSSFKKLHLKMSSGKPAAILSRPQCVKTLACAKTVVPLPQPRIDFCTVMTHTIYSFAQVSAKTKLKTKPDIYIKIIHLCNGINNT